MRIETESGHSRLRLVWMFVPLGLLFLLSQFYRTSSAVIALELMRDLRLNAQSLGLLSSVFFYAFAFVQLPMGAAMDLFGAKKTLVFLALVGLCGTLFFAGARTFTIAMIGRALMGMGMACALMGTFKLFINWYPRNVFATASGLILSFGTLGVMAATAPLAKVVAFAGWRTAFFGMALIHLGVTVWIVLKVRERPENGNQTSRTGVPYSKDRETEPRASKRDFLLVFRHPSFWLISFATFVRYGSYVAISGLWAGPFLREVYRFSLVKTGNYLLAFPLGFVFGSPILGFLSDRVFRHRKHVVVLGMAGYSLMMLPLCLSKGTLPDGFLYLSFMGMGFFTSAGGIMYANIKELLPGRISGTAMTGVNLFTMLGAATFQYGMGALIKHVSGSNVLTPDAFRWGFRLCFLAALAGVFCYLFVREGKLAKHGFPV